MLNDIDVLRRMYAALCGGIDRALTLEPVFITVERRLGGSYAALLR